MLHYKLRKNHHIVDYGVRLPFSKRHVGANVIVHLQIGQGFL